MVNSKTPLYLGGKTKKPRTHMGLSIFPPRQILTSKLSNIPIISILLFYKIFFLNELRVKFLSSLKQKSVKNSEYIFSEVRESVVAATLEIIC